MCGVSSREQKVESGPKKSCCIYFDMAGIVGSCRDITLWRVQERDSLSLSLARLFDSKPAGHLLIRSQNRSSETNPIENKNHYIM
jgi:hypothetical protein